MTHPDKLLTRAEVANWLDVTASISTQLDHVVMHHPSFALDARSATTATRLRHGSNATHQSHWLRTEEHMRYREITESEPVKPSAPLTPAQSQRRAGRQQRAQAKLADTQAMAAIKINAEKRKINEI